MKSKTQIVGNVSHEVAKGLKFRFEIAVLEFLRESIDTILYESVNTMYATSNRLNS